MSRRRYFPAPPPVEPTAEWVFGELLRVAEALDAPATGFQLVPQTAPPSKPREGMVVFADGTHWNPGAGRGVYVYSSAAWSKL